MRRYYRPLTLVSCLLVTPALIRAQIVSPAPGVDTPREVLENARVKGAFEFQHAWIEKTRIAREKRERYIEERGFYKRDMMPLAERQQLAVTGTFKVPVFCVKYSDTGADPFPVAQLQTKLFNGPFSPRTLTQFYNEISYGDLNLTGIVYGWHTLPNNNAYYTGTGTCNGLADCANIPAFIYSALGANDAAVNFGQYDNDGPDGLPNSGDDDGFVDFVAFVHPERGAECGVNGNIWSHRFSLTGWQQVYGEGTGAYTTNDARTGGGFIKIDDYTIQPVLNCNNFSLIDIGVFCHEFGHAFGLPDLYDTDGGSAGVGEWCLMGSGNWNTPTNPAHMSAWSKSQLGWTNVVTVPATPTPFNLLDVETHRDVYRLDIMQEKWRRMSECALTGTYSLRCGLTEDEAYTRWWDGGSGYGNFWDTTVSRDFRYSGSGTVTLQYQYSVDLEPSYDFAYGSITAGGKTSNFVSYSTTVGGTANINLTPYLTSAGPYTISFRVVSDPAASDEDGGFITPCGALLLDNIAVTGGGENYFTDFEAREDGWAETMNPPTEYFLVENRQPIGSDAGLFGGGGLLIWQVDTADQTGGPYDIRPRGVELKQADGYSDLEIGWNRGDNGDPYPGIMNNHDLNGLTVPNSSGHDGPSTVSVHLTSGNANPMSVTMMGGWPAPVPSSVTPASGASSGNKQVQIDGSLFAKTGSAQLVNGASTIASTSIEWVGKDRIIAVFNLTGAPSGTYDVVVYNPGGASGVLPHAFQISGGPTAAGNLPYKNALLPAYPNPFNPETTIRYELAARGHVSLRVYDVSGATVRTLVDEPKAAGSYSLTWNGKDNHGSPVSSGMYFYRITAGSFQDVRKMTLLK
jgi:M6 family metalloprotease-like protein